MLKVIIGNDVAGLYGIETKQVNEAVKNNPEKFPEGYAIELTEAEKAEVVENFDHLQNQKHSKTLAKAFTEKGLYSPRQSSKASCRTVLRKRYNASALPSVIILDTYCTLVQQSIIKAADT